MDFKKILTTMSALETTPTQLNEALSPIKVEKSNDQYILSDRRTGKVLGFAEESKPGVYRVWDGTLVVAKANDLSTILKMAVNWAEKKLAGTQSREDDIEFDKNDRYGYKKETGSSVYEDINIQADGDDAMDLLLKLAGIQSPETNNADDMVPVHSAPAPMPGMSDHIDAVDAGMQNDLPVVIGPGASIADDDMEFDDMETEDFANSPDERIAPLDAAIPSGTDLHREKRAFRAAAGGDNPMAVESLEEKLLNQFRNFVNEASSQGMSKEARARDTEESDREYLQQKAFKDKWKKENPGKKWPGYSAAGFKSK